MADKLIIMIQADGSIRTNARGMSGTEKEIMAELANLSRAVGGGGAVEVEAHVHGAHTHTHTVDRIRTGGGG